MARLPFLNERLQGHETTIFAEMSALAVSTGSINLGQGFPDSDGPEEIKVAAIKAIEDGHNQYPPGLGIIELRQAVAHHQQERYGLAYDPHTEVLVTAGATEAIAAAILALCELGDEVLMFEPYYDAYAACTAMAGATRRVVPLRSPDWSFDPDQLAATITPRTRLLVLNSPHNPTGKVFRRDELEVLARTCIEHDLIAITDEVYEHLIFEGTHIPLASLPGMRERTVTISSAGKTFSFTGWKVGWACAEAPLLTAVRTAKQYLTYVNAAPFQHAIAIALQAGQYLIEPTVAKLKQQRDLLCNGLADLGFAVHPPSSTYFVMTDVASMSSQSGVEFCRSLPERCGVVAIPGSVFYDDKVASRSLVRWTFCKQPSILQQALNRLQGLGTEHADRRPRT